MSRWAKVIIQERSDFALDTPGKPEVTGRAYVWNVELKRFEDFTELLSSVRHEVWNTSYNSVETDEEKLTIHFVLTAQKVSPDDSVILAVGEVCSKFPALVN